MVKYLPGDVICECHSFVHCVSQDQRGRRCDFCMEESGSLRKCGSCGQTWYCDKDCQRADWTSVHKLKECHILARSGGRSCPLLDDGQYRFMLRFVLKAELDPNAKKNKFKLFDGRVRTIDDLMDHADQIEKCPDELSAIITFAAHLRTFSLDIGDRQVLRRCSQLFTNSFVIEGKKSDRSSFHEAIGDGLFIEASIFDHSCEPNACQVFDGTKMQIRATKPIDTEKEEIFISYIIETQRRDVRRELLRNGYRFECNCSKCSTDESFDYDKYEAIKYLSFGLYEQKKFREASAMLEKVLELSVEVSGHYCPLRTELIWNCIQFKMLSMANEKNNVKLKSMEHLKQLIAQFSDAIITTHGRDHSFHKFTAQLLERYNF